MIKLLVLALISSPILFLLTIAFEVNRVDSVGVGLLVVLLNLINLIYVGIIYHKLCDIEKHLKK